MPEYTTNLNLFKYDPSTDAQTAFSITNALNNNWDKIDKAIVNVDGLPSQSGHSGDLLTTNGTTASWADTYTIYPCIETYINGTSWYRIYAADSSGYRWCEQGGQTTASSSATKTVTFLKEFKDAKYTVVLGTMYTSTTTYTPCINPNTKATTGFTLYDSTNTSVISTWVAFGYIIDEE